MKKKLLKMMFLACSTLVFTVAQAESQEASEGEVAPLKLEGRVRVLEPGQTALICYEGVTVYYTGMKPQEIGEVIEVANRELTDPEVSEFYSTTVLVRSNYLDDPGRKLTLSRSSTPIRINRPFIVSFQPMVLATNESGEIRSALLCASVVKVN